MILKNLFLLDDMIVQNTFMYEFCTNSEARIFRIHYVDDFSQKTPKIHSQCFVVNKFSISDQDYSWITPFSQFPCVTFRDIYRKVFSEEDIIKSSNGLERDADLYYLGINLENFAKFKAKVAFSIRKRNIGISSIEIPSDRKFFFNEINSQFADENAFLINSVLFSLNKFMIADSDQLCKFTLELEKKIREVLSMYTGDPILTPKKGGFYVNYDRIKNPCMEIVYLDDDPVNVVYPKYTVSVGTLNELCKLFDSGYNFSGLSDKIDKVFRFVNEEGNELSLKIPAFKDGREDFLVDFDLDDLVEKLKTRKYYDQALKLSLLKGD